MSVVDTAVRQAFAALPEVVPQTPRAADARWFGRRSGAGRAAFVARRLVVATLSGLVILMAAGSGSVSPVAWAQHAALVVDRCGSDIGRGSAPSCLGDLIAPAPRTTPPPAAPPVAAVPSGTPRPAATPTASSGVPGATHRPAPPQARPAPVLPSAQPVTPPTPAASLPATTAAPATPGAQCSAPADTESGTVTGGQAQSFFWNATGTALCATLVWHGSVVLDLVIYNGSGTVTYAEVSPGTSPETLRITTVPGQPYKVKAKPETSSGTSTFTLTVNA